MTQYAFNEETFKNALANARAREAADIAEAARIWPQEPRIIGLKAPSKKFYAAPAPMV